MAKNKHLTMSKVTTGSTKVRNPIEVIKIGRISIYEVTESELDSLRKGRSSVFENICFASASAAISFLVSLFTCDLKGVTLGVYLTLFAVLTIVSVVFGWMAHDKSKHAENTYDSIVTRASHNHV